MAVDLEIGGWQPPDPDRLLAIIARLAERDPVAAAIVELRVFESMTLHGCMAKLNLSHRMALRGESVGRDCLDRELRRPDAAT